MITKTDAIVSLRPKSNFVMVDDVVTEWLDDTQAPPTDSEIEAEVVRLEAKVVQDKINAEQVKQSALAKLMALGLTEEEALSLGVK